MKYGKKLTKAQMLEAMYADISIYMGAPTTAGPKVKRFNRAIVQEIYTVWEIWRNDSVTDRAEIVMSWIDAKSEYC